MIEIILAGLFAGSTIAASSKVNWAASEVNNDYKAELNGINRKMSDLYSDTRQLAESTSEKFERQLKDIYKQKQDIYMAISETVRIFRRIENLKEVKVNGHPVDYINTDKWALHVNTYIDNSVYESKFAASIKCVATSMLGGPFGGIGFKAVEGIRLSYKIDAANEEYERLRLECAKVTTKCEELRGYTMVLSNSFTMIDRLIRSLYRAVRGLDYKLVKIGTCDAREFEKIDNSLWDKITLICDMTNLLDQIGDLDVIESNGTISKRWLGAVEGKSDGLNTIKNDNRADNVFLKDEDIVKNQRGIYECLSCGKRIDHRVLVCPWCKGGSIKVIAEYGV